MNIMFLIGDTLVTPSLAGGSILPGVTRESLLQLVRAQGRKVEEREIAVDELLAANKAGRLKEVFACGTAAVVTPIREIVHKNEVLYRNTGAKPARTDHAVAPAVDGHPVRHRAGPLRLALSGAAVRRRRFARMMPLTVWSFRRVPSVSAV